MELLASGANTLGDAQCGDSLVQGADALAAGVCHGAVALDVSDDLPVVVAGLQAPRARAVDIPRGVGGAHT